MTDGYTRSPLLIKGAFVELGEPFLGPVPNVIVFQYNPETLTRTLAPWTPPSSEGDQSASENTMAAPYDPKESFTLTLEVDATDALEKGDPVALLTGVADRIAALEMLTKPVSSEVLGEALGSLFGAVDTVPRAEVPVVLFIWGPGLILPVRLTSFSVEEQAFSPTLYPIRAKISVGLQVLTPDEIVKQGTEDSLAKDLAVASWKFTMGQREVLARLNLANSVESIIGMLPL